MADEHDCTRYRDLAPELALGLVSGHERAVALAHLQQCPSCREQLGALTELHDRLRALIPPAEPPIGFETRALAAIGAGPPRHGIVGWRRAALGIGTVTAFFAAGWGLATATAPAATLPRAPAPAEAAPGVRTEPVLDVVLRRGTQDVGHVFLDRGPLPWMSLYLDSPPGHGPLTCRLVHPDGSTTDLTTITADPDGDALWSGPLPTDQRPITAVRVIDGSATPIAEAPVPT